MVSIGLSAGAVARIRFAVSCLWEVVSSVRVLREPGQHAVHLPWVNKVRPRLTAAGLVGPDAGLLWHLIPAQPHYLPDFLTPPAAGLTPDLDRELALLLATPPTVVRAELDLYSGNGSAAVREFHADPAAGLRRLVDEISAYWRLALAPDWPRIGLLLDGEVYQRARTLAQDGAAGLLNDLHERVRWEGDTLSISQRHCTAADVADGGGLVLVPSVFVWPSVLSVANADVPQLAFPARGIATLWEYPSRPSGALGAVLGRGRAQLLVELRSPSSTTELARRTGMTAGGVSQHLAALRGAGLVATHRQGRSVLSVRTTLADALLSVAG